MSSPTTTSIDELPLEMISELFEYLPLKDLAACSMVNRRWYSIYAAFKVHRLAATDYHNVDRKWYCSNEAIRENERCLPETFCRLAKKPLLSNLKHLSLAGHSSKFHPNKLNRFRQLVHLKIRIGWSNPARVRLNLPQLKVLVFICFDQHSALSIDCPQLNTLVYYNENENEKKLKVKHPETIRTMKTNWFGAKLVPFKNVECMVTDEFRPISKATIQSLPRLKELRYDEEIEITFTENEFRNEVGSADRLKRMLSELAYEAKRLRGSDFRFTFAGFQLDKVNVDQIDFGVPEPSNPVRSEYVYLKNYQLIEPGALPFVELIDYNRLLSNLTGEIPRCFFEKFTDVYSVYVKNEVQDENHFLWFLKSLKLLRRLSLKNVQLSQEFYDQLAASAPSLNSLSLSGHDSENDPENELQLNFDFIGDLPCLSELFITKALFSESLSSLVRGLGKLTYCTIDVRSREECDCSKKEECVRIRKEGDLAEWGLFNHGSLLLETEKLEEIASLIERLQIGRPPSDRQVSE